MNGSAGTGGAQAILRKGVRPGPALCHSGAQLVAQRRDQPHSEFLEPRRLWRQVWSQMKREGDAVARGTVERLMKPLPLIGSRRGKLFKRSTSSDERRHRPTDSVDRRFTADRPNRIGGGRPDGCQDPHRLGLRRLRDRRRQPLHRRLAILYDTAQRLSD
jgi:hypothetical protein